ncbi:MAG: dihydrofolate reductase family protein [Actinomycetota bacterium]|nr:dihydrofolate reductase family protein [Actinomycetota bacterium]
MSELLYSATMSLDGFIAGVDGDMSWLTEHLAGPNPEADDLMSNIGCLLVGNRTFGGGDPNAGTEKEGAFGGEWSGPSIVLTHDVERSHQGPDVRFFNDLRSAVAAAKAAADGKYVNVLGADVARQCIEEGFLDEVLVFIAPVLLGDGVRLFAREGGSEIRLEPLDRPSVDGPPSLRCRVARST